MACHEDTCTVFGTVRVGEKINYNQDPGPGDYQEAQYLCESYYAEKFDNKYHCMWGPRPKFTEFVRSPESTNDDVWCKYEYYDPVS